MVCEFEESPGQPVNLNVCSWYDSGTETSGPGSAPTPPDLVNNLDGGVDMVDATCSIDGCPRAAYKRGHCRPHYIELRESEPYDLEAVLARFWGYVDKSGDCWKWTGYHDARGYGKFNFRGRLWSCHRLALFFDGVDLGDSVVCHRCDNPPCVNPGHLFLGTRGDNNRDMMQKGRNGQPHGEGQGLTHLTEAQVSEMKALRADGWFTTTLARRYGVHSSTVSRICRGLHWKHHR